MPWSGIIFELSEAKTLPGQEVLVTGSARELGCWDVNEVVDRENYRASGSSLLRTDASSYPRWSMSAPVWFEFSDEPEAEVNSGSNSRGAAALAAGTNWSEPGVGTVEISYKYVKVCRSNGGRSYQWEDGIPNRRARVPCQPDAIWRVADATWAGQGPCHITQIKQSDVLPHHLQSVPRHPLSELDMGIVTPAGLSARSLPSTPQARESPKNEVLYLQEELSLLGNMAAEPRTNWQVNESAMSDVQCLQDVKELKDLPSEIWKGRETQETWSLRGATGEHQQSRVGEQSGNDQVQSLREVVVLLMDVAAELSKKRGAGAREENELWSLRDEVSRLKGAEAELRRSQAAQKRAEDEIRSLRDEVSRLMGAEAELTRSQDVQKRAEDEIRSLRDEVSRLTGAEAELRSSQDAQKRAEYENRSLHDEVSWLKDVEAELRSSQNIQKRAEDEIRSLRDEVSRLRHAEAELWSSQDAQKRAENELRSLRDEVSRLRDAEAKLRSSQDAQTRAENELRSLRDEVSRLRDAEVELLRNQQAYKGTEDELRSLREEVLRLRGSALELQKSQEARNKLCSQNNLLREQLARGKIRPELNAEATLQKKMLPSKELVEETCERRASRALGITAGTKSRQARALEALRSVPPEAQNELMKALEKLREKLAAAGLRRHVSTP